jgi:CBS domain-containing protein
MHIAEVLRAKAGHEVVTISPDASVRDLVALLAEHNIGALLVCREGRILEGIVSERDVVRRLHEDDGVLDAPVSAIMTSTVETCGPETLLDDLMKTMTEHRVRHVPVVVNGDVRGIISIGDVVKHRIDQLEFERDQLDSYVHQT